MAIRKFVIGLALCAASMSVSACAASSAFEGVSSNIVAAVDDAADTVVIRGSQSLGVAHNAYQGVTAALIPLVRAGVFPQPMLAKIDELNNRALHLLTKGDEGMSVATRASEVIQITRDLEVIKGDSS